MKNTIICDIDQTIANNQHRQHYLDKKKNWDGFFNALNEDKPIWEIINLLISEQVKNKKIIFITGRHEKYRKQTKHWLEQYFNFSIELFMRANNDKRNKVIVKKELFRNNLEAKNILYVIDDDDDLLSMWKSLGLECVDAKKFI